MTYCGFEIAITVEPAGKASFVHTCSDTRLMVMAMENGPLSPGKTIEQSWIQHPTLLDVNVEIVAKHYPTLLDETSHRCKLVLNLI